MTDRHRLKEAHIEGRGVDPAGSFSVEALPAPEGWRLLVLTGELDMAAGPRAGARARAAGPAGRARGDEAAGARGLVIDLAEVTFVDSSMLQELLRAAA